MGARRLAHASEATRRSSPLRANVAAAGLTERAGTPIGFRTFLKIGVPVTLISIVLATVYVWLRYVTLD